MESETKNALLAVLYEWRNNKSFNTEMMMAEVGQILNYHEKQADPPKEEKLVKAITEEEVVAMWEKLVIEVHDNFILGNTTAQIIADLSQSYVLHESSFDENQQIPWEDEGYQTTDKSEGQVN